MIRTANHVNEKCHFITFHTYIYIYIYICIRNGVWLAARMMLVKRVLYILFYRTYFYLFLFIGEWNFFAIFFNRLLLAVVFPEINICVS